MNLQLLLTVFCSLRYIKSVSVIDLATLLKVPGGLIGMDELAIREMDTAFADVICADPQWLREEFDELISASFDQPPAPPPPAPPRVPPSGRGRPPSRRRPGVHPARVAPARAAQGRRRQRSPPA
jgi:hypothetical protein